MVTENEKRGCLFRQPRTRLLPELSWLELKSKAKLDDTRRGGRRDLTKRRAVNARKLGIVLEIYVVKDVECLEPELKLRSFSEVEIL